METLSEDEAIRRADQKYLEAEQTGEWSAWNGPGTSPWWVAGCDWVETVILAFGERVLLAEHRFNDSLRGRLFGESRKQAGAVYDRKLWLYDSALRNPTSPAPAAQTWAAVAQAMGKGLDALAPAKIWSIVIGGAVGVVFAILPVIFPKQEKYLPSASGFGLAWIFQWYYGVLFFMGAVIAWWFAKKSPARAEEFTFPVASGVMAGGALMGVAIRSPRP